jgi:hypothetical protein
VVRTRCNREISASDSFKVLMCFLSWLALEWGRKADQRRVVLLSLSRLTVQARGKSRMLRCSLLPLLQVGNVDNVVMLSIPYSTWLPRGR